MSFVLMSIWVISKSWKESCLAKKLYKWPEKKINGTEYEHVLNVWNEIEMKPRKDYYLYLKSDVSLLADVFEKFRNNSLKNYGVFPSHYLSAAGWSWDGMLRVRKAEIALFPDRDMYIFFEKRYKRQNFLYF